jgi:hypothetical protein
MAATWAELGLSTGGGGTRMAVRDVWRQRNWTATERVVDPAVPGHSVTLLVLTPS